jgi:hypothetical protein
VDNLKRLHEKINYLNFALESPAKFWFPTSAIRQAISAVTKSLDRCNNLTEEQIAEINNKINASIKKLGDLNTAQKTESIFFCCFSKPSFTKDQKRLQKSLGTLAEKAEDEKLSKLFNTAYEEKEINAFILALKHYEILNQQHKIPENTSFCILKCAAYLIQDKTLSIEEKTLIIANIALLFLALPGQERKIISECSKLFPPLSQNTWKALLKELNPSQKQRAWIEKGFAEIAKRGKGLLPKTPTAKNKTRKISP